MKSIACIAVALAFVSALSNPPAHNAHGPMEPSGPIVPAPRDGQPKQPDQNPKQKPAPIAPAPSSSSAAMTVGVTIHSLKTSNRFAGLIPNTYGWCLFWPCQVHMQVCIVGKKFDGSYEQCSTVYNVPKAFMMGNVKQDVEFQAGQQMGDFKNPTYWSTTNVWRNTLLTVHVFAYPFFFFPSTIANFEVELSSIYPYKSEVLTAHGTPKYLQTSMEYSFTVDCLDGEGKTKSCCQISNEWTYGDIYCNGDNRVCMDSEGNIGTCKGDNGFKKPADQPTRKLFCKGKPDGDYQDPLEPCAHHYLLCSFGAVAIFPCPSHLYFNEEADRCDVMERANPIPCH